MTDDKTTADEVRVDRLAKGVFQVSAFGEPIRVFNIEDWAKDFSDKLRCVIARARATAAARTAECFDCRPTHSGIGLALPPTPPVCRLCGKVCLNGCRLLDAAPVTATAAAPATPPTTGARMVSAMSDKEIAEAQYQCAKTGEWPGVLHAKNLGHLKKALDDLLATRAELEPWKVALVEKQMELNKVRADLAAKERELEISHAGVTAMNGHAAQAHRAIPDRFKQVGRTVLETITFACEKLAAETTRADAAEAIIRAHESDEPTRGSRLWRAETELSKAHAALDTAETKLRYIAALATPGTT